MNLKEFKEQIEKSAVGKIFSYGISEPFAWRGYYEQVAFNMLERQMTREEILSNIEKAYTKEFRGYKGGYYTYDDFTEVNFEYDNSSYSDGGYCSNWIAKLEGPYISQEMRLVKLAFN